MASIDRVLTVDDDKEAELQKNNKKVVEAFRKCFSTPEGQIVLNQLLVDLKYYDECTTPVDEALNNYAKFMIKTRLQVNNKKKITEAIFNAKSETIF